MASRFWVGGSGIWDATLTHWSATSGGAGGASVPTSTDDVIFDTLSNATAYTVSIATVTANCANLTIGNPASGTVGFGSNAALNIFGSVNIASGVTSSYSGQITFSATAAGKTITTNGLLLSNAVNFNGVGGGWQLQDDFNIQANALNITNGTLNTNGKTVTCSNVVFATGTYTLTCGASVFNLSGVWNVVSGTFTLNANTSTINLLTAGTFTGGGKTYNIVQMTGAGTYTLSGANTFATLTYTGTAVKTNVLQITSNQIITGTLTINGNSAINRVAVVASPSGTPKTFTAATVVVTNANFSDIVGAGAGSWNLSAIAGGSGDGGGNSGITFTPAVDQHWQNSASSSWSTLTNWTSRVPLLQDNVFMDKAFGTSVVVTLDMPQAGKSIDWTGATFTTALTWSTASSFSIFGSLTLIPGMTVSGSGPLVFGGRGSYTLTSAGVAFAKSITMAAPTGTITLQDDLTITNLSLFLNYGTFNANGKNVTAAAYSESNGANSATVFRSLLMGSGTWNMTGAGSPWINTATTGYTFNAGTSTIKFTSTANSALSFQSATFTYNLVWLARGTSTGTNTFTGSSTMAELRDTGTAAHSNLFTAATTTTVTLFTVAGTAGNLVTIGSVTAATHTLTKAGGGIISSDYLSISQSTATPANTWYAGTHSTNGGSNSGWIFTAPPVGGTNSNFFALFN